MAAKGDWALHGLPLEGHTAGRRRALDLVRQAARCGPETTLVEARSRAEASGDPLCAVVDPEGVLLGRIDGAALEGDPAAKTGDVMETGPATEKPDTFLHDLVARVHDGPHPSTLVTSREYHDGGRLLGALYLADVERVLAENAELPREGEAGG